MRKTSEEFASYDAADYLSSIEGVAAYLEAAIDEAGENPAGVAAALGAIARSRNISELSRRTGMSREGLYKALSAEGNPSFATIMKVTTALGLRIEFHAISEGRGTHGSSSKDAGESTLLVK